MAKMKYTRMTGGMETRGTRVANPQVYPDIALRPKGELIAPVLSFALVSGNPLILECSEELDGDFVPAASAFDVQKNSGSAAITSVAVVGTTVKLTMTVAIVQGDTLTVAYTRPTANTRLRDLRGNEVASFTATTVLNYTPGAADTTVPTLALATVQGANMVLYFDEQLDPASVPAVTAFAVVIGGGADVVTVVAINGNVVRLTLTTAATYGQSATVAYTVPGANMLQDLAGNDVATFGATTALNYTGTTPDTTAPRFSFAIVNTTTIRMVYDEQLDTGSVPATTAFSVVVNGAAGVNPSAVAINGDTVSLTITAVVSTDTVTVAYTAPGANMIQDLAGNDAASLGAQTCINVTNNPDTQVPRLSLIVGDGANIRLYYDEQLTVNTPTLTAFAVVVDGAATTENSISVSGNVATVVIATALTPSDTFTVAYTAGVTKIQDLAANVAADFTATAGINVTGPSGTYSAILSATPQGATGSSYWDGFEGRAATVASSERYEAATSGGTTPVFQADGTWGNTILSLGNGVSLATEYSNFGFTSTFTPLKGRDYGFKVIVHEDLQPTIGAGTLYYLVGFLVTITSSSSDGIYFRCQNSGNWFLVCRNGGVETTVDLGIVSDTTRRLLEFRITGDGTSVQAYVDNVATGIAITTNLPTVLLRCYALVICDAGITSNAWLALGGWGIQPGF